MKNWEDAVVIRQGEKIAHRSTRTKGSLHETDVITAEVHDASGNLTSHIEAQHHTDIGGGGETVFVRQVSVNGEVLVDKAW